MISSNNVPEYKPTCLAVAQKMFAEVGNHLDACIILYQLQQFKALIEYTKETAEFTKSMKIGCLYCKLLVE